MTGDRQISELITDGPAQALAGLLVCPCRTSLVDAEGWDQVLLTLAA